MPSNLARCGIGALATTVAALLTPGVATADTQAPAVPTNLHVQTLLFTNATLAWNPSADDSGWVMYEIEAKSSAQSLVRLGSTTARKTVNGLKPGLTYTVTVVAVDGARNKSAPATIEFTTPVDRTPPTVPTLLQAATANGVVDAITWQPSADSSAVRYVLRSSGNRIFGTAGTRVTVHTLLYLDCVVLPGSTHTLTVEALDAFDNVSARSRTITVTFPG
jgi:predicted phage tail protein